MHVAIVDEELPYPPTSGKRIRTLNLVLRLARRHRITYLCQRNADEREAGEGVQFFQERGIEPILVKRTIPAKSGITFYGRLAANLFSPRPYSVASHKSRALEKAVRTCVTRQPIDLWQCEWTPYAEALRVLSGEPWLVMAHNIESQIWQRYYQTETSRLKRWYVQQQWRKFEHFEKRVFAKATGVVTVSSLDAALARTHFGARRVAVVDNGVDTSFFQPDKATRQPRSILFLGSLDWRPNLDAARLLLEEIFPAVLAKESSAHLFLVGRNPPEWLKAWVRSAPNVELAGNVADVRPYLHRSSVMAVPLRVGGGSRLKILEALACGLPVVSTRVGAEGLCLETGRHLTVVQDVPDMAEALVKCLRDPFDAQSQAAAGRQRVLERYDWDILADRLEGIWRKWVAM